MLTVSSQEESFYVRPSVRIVMPDNLKSLLVDDWENVTKNQQVVALPAKSPVNQILDDYVREEKEKRTSSADMDVLDEVVMGVREYFDKALDKVLLYRFEREQYRALRKKWEAGSGDYADKGSLDIYGAEHLTRLFGMFFFHFENHSFTDRLYQRPCPSSSRRQIWTSSPQTDSGRNYQSSPSG